MLSKWSLLLAVVIAGNACAVERPNPSLEIRSKKAGLVVVADEIERLPMTGKEFSKFYRVSARVAGILKGKAKIGDRIVVVVDGTISEQRNDCCVPGKTYVMFLELADGKFYFVGSPLGAVPLELSAH